MTNEEVLKHIQYGRTNVSIPPEIICKSDSFKRNLKAIKKLFRYKIMKRDIIAD